MSIHSGSTIEEDGQGNTVQGVDAYRDITLSLQTNTVVSNNAPTINIKADFDKLLSGSAHTITLGENNATPNIHTAVEMTKFVDNLGGNVSGMFSITGVEN